MQNPQDQKTSTETSDELVQRTPAFQRPVFVSEEVWNKKFPPTEEIWATDGEMAQAMDRIAQAEGADPSQPWVTLGLVATNVLLFAGAVALGVDPRQPSLQSLSTWGANVGPAVIGGQWWRLFTAMFLHIGFIHILFNMVALWSIGGFVERLLGRTGFGIVYVLAGLGASLTSIAWNPDVVSAGASGAIFGLFGALLGFLVREPKCVPPGVWGRLVISAVLFILYNMLHAVNASGIDVAGHLGGLVTGWACGLFIAVPATKEGLSRRPRANAWVLAAGLAGVGGLALFLPRISGDTGRLVVAGMAEKRALAAFEASAEKVRKGTFTQAQFADSIDKEVVPGFRECRVRLEALVEVPRFSTEKLEALIRVTRAEEEAYAVMAHALRTGNEMEAAMALRKRGDAMAQFQAEMKALNP